MLISGIKHYIQYLKLKRRWRGKLIFNYQARIADGSKFEGANKVVGRSYFNGKMGYGSYIGSGCYFVGDIGRFTSIAGKCEVVVGRHPYTFPFATTCPMFFSTLKQNGYTFTDKQLFEEFKYAKPSVPVSVGADCWIGHDVKIIGGVSIGDGAVVLAGAVVTKDIPPYAIVGGIPATIKGFRFDEETIKFLLYAKWWNNPIEWFAKHWQLLCDVEQLKNYYSYHKKDGESRNINNKTTSL